MHKKKLSTLILMLVMATSIFGQANFPVTWDTKFENDADYWKYTSADGKFVVGTTKKEVSVLSGASGKPLWKKSFIDMAGVKEAKSQQIMEETETMLFISKQKGNDELFCVDLNTGNKLWSNDQFNDIDLGNLIFIHEAKCYVVLQKNGLTLIDEKTGKERGTVDGIKGVIGRYAYLKKTNQLLLFAYQVNSLKAIGSGLKNNLVCIDLATAKVNWNTVIKGVVEIKKSAGKNFSVFDWATVGVEKGVGSSSVLVDLLIRENKAFIIMNGLMAFDLTNGSKLWEVEFDLSLNRGMGGSSQLYNAVAEPLFTKEHIYLASFEKGRDKSLKKYDIETGKLLWETPIDGRKVIIPSLTLINGMLIAQIGGFTNIQGDDSGGFFSKWKWQGPFGLKAFNVETGKLTWETEKFDDRITNMLVTDNKLIVADENSVYSMNTATGEKAFEVKLKESKVGKALYLFTFKERIMILGEEGLAAFNNKGVMQYNFKAKDALMDFSDTYGDHLYYLGTEDEVIAMNLETGKEIGRFNYKKGYKYGIKDSGNMFIQYKDNKVTRYAVN